MQVPAECLASARRQRAAALRVTFTSFSVKLAIFILASLDSLDDNMYKKSVK